MKKYFFARGEKAPPAVTIRQGGLTIPLDPRHDLWLFGQGHIGWGAAIPSAYQLALALLADATQHDGIAAQYATEFALAIVCGWTKMTFSVSEEDIVRWVITVLSRDAFVARPEDSIDLSTCHLEDEGHGPHTLVF